MNILPMEKKVRVVAALAEGCSIRATERLTGVNRETVMRLGVDVGEGCRRLHDRLFRNLNVGVIELDEAWSYVAKKQKRLKPTDPVDFGDQYVFVALAATQKAILSYAVGKREGATTNAFVADLRARIVNRPQITSDGFKPYIDAVDRAFGCDVDFAQLVKQYGGEPGPDAARRYSPGYIIGAVKTPIMGAPEERLVSTSYVERSNLTLRMGSRRFTRLTNAFSKKLRNHEAAVDLQFAHYNLCRVHEALRVTPAMALDVTRSVWTIAELVETALAEPGMLVPPSGPPPAAMARAIGDNAAPRPRPALRLIQGGLA